MSEQIEALLRRWNLPPLAWNAILIGAALLTGLVIQLLFSLFIRKKSEQAGRFSFFRSFTSHLGTPLSYFLPLFIFNLLLPLMRLSPAILRRLAHAVEIGLILTFSWILVQCMRIAQDYVMYRFDINKKDNLRERKIRTQLLYIRQVLTGLIVLLTVAAVLLTFSTMRKIGAGLLTGVGIGGIIIGFAAQRSLGNLLAGFQIAFTQPLRIDDAVVVEGEFGTVEEITLTYVVVRVWDERRLILPINYFLEKPFQNWTRNSAQMLGTVMLYTDYLIPLDPLRAELNRLLQSSPLWDSRVGAIQVTNVTDQSVELRVLVSGRNSGELFDLRCFVREHLLGFIHREYPQYLPRTRAEVISGEAPGKNA